MAVPGSKVDPEGLTVSREAVRGQLDRVRSSPPFRSSKRCLQLLDHIVTQWLDGQSDRLKERSLGVDVFGRQPGYDTAQDPIVRYTAGEVRKRLAQYYQTAGHAHELRILLPAGSYLPEIEVPPAPQQAPPAVEPPVRRPNRVALVALALVPIGLVAAWLARDWASPTALDRFWEPVLSDPRSVLLSVGEAKVFSFAEPNRSEVRSLSEVYFRAGKPVPQTVFGNKDLLPLWDRYVPIGDAVCLARLSAMFQEKGKFYRIRGGTATSLADLRDGSGVLIGAFTNPWTLQMTEGLRFTLEFDSRRSLGAIRDRQRPNGGWEVPNTWPDPKRWTDYALVSRLRHPSTGRMIITAAGLNRYGTSAAGEFLTSPDTLEEALGRLPAGWERRNLQIVLSTVVVDTSAGPPKVEASHVW